MRGWLSVLGVLVCGLLLSSCTGRTVSKDTLVGTWKAAGQERSPQAEVWKFGADGNVVMTSMGTRHEGTYTLSGATLEIKFSDLPAAVTWEISIDGNAILTIKKGRSSRDWFSYRKIK